MATRWGIIGSGTICHDFTAAIQMLPDTEHKVHAVAASTLEKASAFNVLFDNSIPHVYGSYTEIAQNPDIDIVYIGLVIALHHRVARQMLEAGKNVLVEKPMGMNVAEVRDLIQLAKKKKVFFMEGFWSRFFPVYKHLQSEIASGVIGDVHTVSASFGVPLKEYLAMRSMPTGVGALVDIGCYPIMLATLIFGERPARVCTSGGLAEKGYDLYSHTTLHYSGGRRAQLNSSEDALYDNEAVIMGTKGLIRMPNLWSPDRLVTPNKTYECPLPACKRTMKIGRSEGFVYELAGVRDCLLAGQTESSTMPHEHSIIISEIMQEILKQLGVVYPKMP